MPDSVVAAAPTLVCPKLLCSAFQQTQAWTVDENRYKDASLQSRAISTAPRHRWQLTSRRTAAQLTALRNFYLAVGGPWKEFFFYDLYLTVPIFSYDPTGFSSAGRFTVCFEGPFHQALDLGRNPAQLALVEVS